MHVFVKAKADLYRQVVERAASGLDVLVCLTELIDNALDANATHVRVDVRTQRSIKVRDNGDGVPSVESLVDFGGHVAHRTTRSGTYGVGFKDAALALGGEQSRVLVSTTHKGDKFVGTIDWQRLRSTDQCLEGDVTRDPDAPQGTEIVIAPLRIRFPDGARRDKLLSDLGYIYSPALKHQRVLQITAGGKDCVVQRWELPPLEDVIDQRIDLGGKRARLRAGLVAHGHPNPRKGLTYCHGWRVVKGSSKAGCGTYGVDRICGFVEIDGKGWARTKNKTDLVDADDLYEEVERLLTPLLRKAAERAHSIEFEGARAVVEAMLSSAILGNATEKAKRGRGEKDGAVLPSGAGGKHETAKNRQPGTTFGRRKANAIVLHFETGWSPGCPIGKWDLTNKAGHVTLYKDHPLIASALQSSNRTALFLSAMFVVAVNHKSDSSDQGSYISSHEALNKLAEYTAAAATIDGEQVAQAAE